MHYGNFFEKTRDTEPEIIELHRERQLGIKVDMRCFAINLILEHGERVTVVAKTKTVECKDIVLSRENTPSPPRICVWKIFNPIGQIENDVRLQTLSNHLKRSRKTSHNSNRQRDMKLRSYSIR